MGHLIRHVLLQFIQFMSRTIVRLVITVQCGGYVPTCPNTPGTSDLTVFFKIRRLLDRRYAKTRDMPRSSKVIVCFFQIRFCHSY